MANAKTNVEIMLPFADNEKHVVSVTPTATKSSVITPVVVKGTNTIPSKAETIFTLPTTTTNTASKPTTTNIGFENSGLTRDEYDSKVRSNYTQTDAFKYSDSYGSTLKKDAEEKQAAYLALGGTDALDPEEAEAARLAAKEAQKKYDDWTTEKFQYNQSQALDRLSDDELAYVQTIVDANDAIELYNTAAAYTGGYSRYADVGISEDFDAKKKATDELKNLGYTQEQIDAFVEYQKYRSDAEKAAAEEEKLQQEATEHPVAADLGAFAANLGSGIGALTGFARALTSTDPYAPLNVNSSDFAGVRVAQTVREQRAENIENSVDNELLGKTLSFLYGVGGSIADSATVVATMGPASVYFLGTTAAANAAKDITERGGSVKQAALGAAAAGLIEILTEKVSVENLLNSVGNTKTLTAVLKQAGVEATEEISADVLNTVSDSIIMRGKSNYNIAVAQYMMQGLSEEEAQRQALIDIAKQTALSGAAGAISGGVMSGGLNVANSLFNNVRAAGTDTQATVDTETAEGAQGEITPDTAQAATTQETEASVLQTAVDAYKESGTVTNETARRIIASPEAVAELGIDLSNMTASQQRLAVKGAIAEFAEVDNTVTGGYNVSVAGVGSRSTAASDVIERLNRGENLSIDEVMQIPEIAEAESQNEGTPTILLPGREQVRQKGYASAMSLGSWGGSDYDGPVRQERRMDIVIGLPGSGKSSVFTDRISMEHGSRVVDTDDYRDYIPEYNKINAAIVHDEASLIKNLVLDAAIERGDNIILSTVGADAEKLAEQISEYKQDGYSVYLHLNELANNKAMARAINRYVDENGKRGRYVSPYLIAKHGDSPTQTYLTLTRNGGITNATETGLERNRGKVDGDLREGRGQNLGNVETPSSTKIGAAGNTENLISGYDWYSNDVANGEKARLIESSDGYSETSHSAEAETMSFSIPKTPATPQKRSSVFDINTAQTVPTDINGNPEGHGAMSNPYVQRRAQSRTTSLYTNEADVPDEYSQPIEHDVISNAQSMGWGTERVQQGVDEEIEALRAKTEWSGEDVDTAGIILEQLRSKARESSDDADWQAYRDMRKLYADRVGEAGRALQATQKWVVTDGNSIIDKADEALEQAEKAPKNIRDTISRYANRFDTATAEQSAADFVQIIRDAAITRRTAGMYSESFGKEIEWALERLWLSGSDANYDFLRQMAGQSIVNIASDYIPAAAVDKVHSYRRLSMLSKASTTLRNLIGTGSFIGLDLMSNDLSVPLDMLLAEVTGTRSVGVEKVGKAAVESSLDALAKSVAQVGLDVDATGSNSSYETTNGRTYKMTGGLFSRFMSTWEKYSNYAMSSTDQLYQGFSQGMTQEAIDELIQQQFVADDTLETAAQDAALYRAFNDESAPAKLLLDIRRAIDRRTPNLKLGTAIAPFTKIAANLAARNFDYSPVGMVKGLAEVLNVVVNTKKGNTVTAAQQSKAVRDVGRGFTGSAMIALAAYAALKGVLHVEGMDEDDDNKNRNAVMAAQGVDGTQLNVSALLRGLKSESTDWRDDDKLLSVGYLQPINFLLTVGAYLAADMKDGLQLSDIINSTTRGFVESLAQLPLVDAFVDAVESAQYSESRVDQVWDALASFGGSTVASFIPNAVRGIAQGIDTTQRDIYGTDNKLEQVLNQIKSALPVLRNTIPAKTDSYGNELTYGDSVWQNFLNSNLRAGNKTRFQTTELETELNRLYNATESASAYPAREAPSSITYDKQKYVLDDEQKSIYQKAYGDAYESLSNDFFGSDIYHMLDDNEKIDIYSQIKEYAAESAKAAVLGAEDLKESVAEISDLSDPAMYIAANRMFNDANNDNDWSDIERLFANGGVPDDVAEALGTDYSKNKAVYEAGVDLAEYHDMKSAFNEGYKAATDDDESTVPDYSAIDAVIDTYNALQEEQRSVIDDVLNAMTLSKAAGAAEVGINSETWFDIYNTYKDIDESDANATDKQTELEHTIDIMLGLSSAQKQYAKDILTYFTIVPAEASKYNALKASGLSPERAEYVYELAQRAPTIYSTDSAGNSERAVWIARCSMNDDEKLAALSTYFSDGTEGSTYKKCVNALEQGISVEKFTRFWYEKNNGNKNTNYSKYSSLENYLYAWGQNNGYTSQEVSTLYQLLK